MLKNFEELATEYSQNIVSKEAMSKLRHKKFELAKIDVLNALYDFDMSLKVIDEFRDPAKLFYFGASYEASNNIQKFCDVMKDFRPKLKDVFNEIWDCQKFEELETLATDFTNVIFGTLGNLTISRITYTRHSSGSCYIDRREYFPERKYITEGIEDVVISAIKNRVKFRNRDHINILMRHYRDFENEAIHMESAFAEKVSVKKELSVNANTYMLYPQCHRTYGEVEAFTRLLAQDVSNVLTSQNFDCGAYFCNSSQEVPQYEYEWLNAHIAKGGLSVLVVPIALCDSKFLKLLSRNMENITVIQTESGFVAFIGKKRQKISINVFDHINLVKQMLFEEYSLDEIVIDFPQPEEVKFRSKIIEKYDVSSLFIKHENNVSETMKMINSCVESKNKEEEKRPMIPFSAGQLGLALVSGYIDGVIVDEDGNKHLIKGSTHRETNVANELSEEEDSESVVKTTSSMTSVKVFLADGTFISL